MLTVKTQLKDFYEDIRIKEAKAYLIGNGEALFQVPGLTFEAIQMKQPTWYAQDMVFGANRLLEVAENGDYIYQVYSDEDVKLDPDKKDVQLLHFPAQGEDRRFVLLVAGGGYGCVCSLEEAFPVAAKLNELGITAFCLNYRIVKDVSALKEGLLPKPEEDIAAALRFIQNHAQEFTIDPENYAMGGFSAGGNAVGLWGMKEFGFRNYQLPAPALLMLCYPLVSGKNLQDSEMARVMLSGMYGPNYSQETAHRFYIDEHIDAAYPPSYVIQSEDDDTVPIQDSVDLVTSLRKSQVKVVFERLQSGGHGFGLGTNTPGNGWVERAVTFWNDLQK